MTICEAAKRISGRELSPVELLRSCLGRIDALEEGIRAWVMVDREGAMSAARRAEAEMLAGRPRGPLHGIPLGIKDIIDVKGMPTRAGSRIRSAAPPAERDATIVLKLREAGAVILGKTVTTEYACFDPAETRNPWNPSHTPGGSSSGSAAAVASGMCLGAIGSQTGGSISRPAAYCGIVGCKPTYGRVSANGVIPVSFSLDHPGPMGRCVEDAALLLRTIAGHDPADPFTAEVPVEDYAAACGPWRGGRPQLGLPGGLFIDRADSDALDGMERARGALEQAGATLSEAELPPGFDKVHRMHRILMCAEMAAVHRYQFESRESEYRPGIREMIREGLALSAVDYAEARNHQVRFKAAAAALARRFDALLTPAAPGCAPRDLSTTGDPVFNSPWSYSGLPTVVLPVCLAPSGLPVGIQLVGRPFGERDLFCLSAWVERAIGFNAVPPGDVR